MTVTFPAEQPLGAEHIICFKEPEPVEIRCPACVELGWDRPRLILTIYGEMTPSTVKIQYHCSRCKSLVKWTYGTTEMEITHRGPQNEKKRKVAFE